LIDDDGIAVFSTTGTGSTRRPTQTLATHIHAARHIVCIHGITIRSLEFASARPSLMQIAARHVFEEARTGITSYFLHCSTMSDEDVSYNSDLPPESSEDECDSSASTAPLPPMRGRRQGVSAEISQGSQEDPKPIASYAKTAEDSHFLTACMSTNPLFQHLSPDSMETVVSAFFLTEKQNGDLVMTQGADGDNFYVIQEGSVKIIVNGNQVATKGAGGSFGELALMYNAPRTATVICDGRAKLWALDRASFQAIMKVTESGRNSKVRSLRLPSGSQLLSHCPTLA
jgi:uncharacterized Zn-binding protein involved in type VI secretion